MHSRLMKNYFDLLMAIGRSYQHRRRLLCCKYTKSYELLLQFLAVNGFILSYRIIDKMLLIYLKRAYHSQTVKQFAFNFGRFNKAPNKRYLTVSAKTLRKVHRYDTG